ncbi:MAG: PQQ-like beta-propeller repeat protein [Deltaproteobacteria bacterium]|nr:PQQ-like beta-propeller repeat protein [Deltaproteobacteria bacterium]
MGTDARAQVSFEPLAGWTHVPVRESDPTYGVALETSAVGYTSPTIAEIDGDPSNGLEVAVGSQNGVLSVLRSDGTLLWSARMPNADCNEKPFQMFSSPAVGTLYGDGTPYVVVGYGGILARDCDGGVSAFRGPDGSVAWNFSVRKLAKSRKIKERNYGVYSSPALADVDGDGKLEVGFGSYARHVFLLEHNGKPRFYYNTADTVWSSPAFADINGDSQKELLIGSDISKNTNIRPATANGGYVIALRTSKPKDGPKYNFRDKRAVLWQTNFDQTIFSSPAVGDIDPTRPGLELAIGSGCYFGKDASKPGKWIKILRASNGKVIRTLPTSACSSSSPALADIEGDGDLEVFSVTDGTSRHGGDGFCRVAAWRGTETTPIWNRIVYDGSSTDENCGDLRSPVVADLDGNGSLEVAVSVRNAVIVLDAATGASLTCEGDCSADSRPRIRVFNSVQSTPAIGDIDRDGRLELVVGSNYRSRGMIFAFTSLELGSIAGPHAPYAAPWPMFRGNARHDALYRNEQ